MPSLLDIALLTGAAAAASAAAAAAAGTVSVAVLHRSPLQEHFESVAGGINKRASSDQTVNLLAANNISGGGYYAELGIGTPPQTLTFQLDTGSSDTWVNSKDTALCKSLSAQRENGFCTATFDPAQSSTFKMVSQGTFDITYLDRRKIIGDYFNDSVSVSGHTVTNQQLGLATTSVRPTGIMGLGFSDNVASTTKYPTIIDDMLMQGVIQHPSFSLYLNDISSPSGTILFGGVDSGKYYDSLKTLPLQPLPSSHDEATNITSYAISIKGISANGVSVPAVKSNSVAVLDSGSTTTLVPDNIAIALQNHYGAINLAGDSSTQIPALVDCAYRGSKGSGSIITFSFDGKDIKIPVMDMVINAVPQSLQSLLKDPTTQGVPTAVRNWDGVCLWGLGSSRLYGIRSDQFFLLGDTFLRSSYVVYDTLNKQIGLAQANLNSTASNIVAIEKNAKTLPSVSGEKEPANIAGSGSSRDTPPVVGVLCLLVFLLFR